MKAEILELLKLKGWKQADLADALQVAESTVWRWVDGEMPTVPIKAFQIILRQWLTEARAETSAKKQKQPA